VTLPREYLVAVGSVVLVTAAGLLLQTVIENTNPIAFLLFVPPLLVTAAAGGLRPSLVAMTLGGVSAQYFFRRPYLTLPTDFAEIVPMLLYLVIGAGVCIVAERLERARQDVQRREREFNTLFELTPIGIGIANDPACAHVTVNPAFAEQLKISTVENGSLSAPVGERPAFQVLADGKPVAAEDLPLQRAARLGIDVRNAELDVVRADGTTVTLYEYAAPLFDDEGKVRGAIGAFLDISELKQAEASLRRLASDNQRLYRQAQEASQLKDEFLATLSHELRTPINALLGWIQLLKTGRLEGPTFQRAVDAVERSARLQAQLTSDLLDVSAAVTGRLRLDPQPVHVAPLVEGVSDALRPAADSKGLRLTVDVDVPHVLVLDPARMQQILWNLISNAVKFTPRGGTIGVHVAIEAGELMLRVSDSGSGIAPDFLPHVFDRFRQADSGPARRHGGLGLGLAIVKQIVELHGGRVTAESAGHGTGAIFTVHMPAKIPETEAASSF
jgi:PAS domain S-box-containing protein